MRECDEKQGINFAWPYVCSCKILVLWVEGKEMFHFSVLINGWTLTHAKIFAGVGNNCFFF